MLIYLNERTRLDRGTGNEKKKREGWGLGEREEKGRERTMTTAIQQ